MGPPFLIKLLLHLGYRTRYRFTLLYNGIILLTKLQDLKILLSYPLLRATAALRPGYYLLIRAKREQRPPSNS